MGDFSGISPPLTREHGDAAQPGVTAHRMLNDPDETHVLPEIVHDGQPWLQGRGLVVWIVVILVAAGGGFLLGRASVPAQQASAENADTSYDDTAVPAAPRTTPAAANASNPNTPQRHYSHAGEAQGATVIAAAKPASGMMYVQRMNSDLRDQPSYDAQVIKKEAKGAQVQLLALSDKWAKIKDGNLTGWMRASVLKDTPPGETRKKKSGGDDSN